MRFLLLLLSLLMWLIGGLYSVYINKLKLEQYKLLRKLRELKKENNFLYWKIYSILNFDRALELAKQKGFKEVKPYRVANFYPTLKDKPLVDFYFVWFNDTLSGISKKLGVSKKELIKYNPSLRWGYLIPGMRIKYPVSFPFAVEQKNDGKQNHSPRNYLVPGKSQTRDGRGNASDKLQKEPFNSIPNEVEGKNSPVKGFSPSVEKKQN
ncbi:MAG TPA: LysM domain-containing protein [Aquifex aeolicus]|uniref:LysM domain-containing protein n=1 Tax=Aquifex aeolicus TaxID=63363 RepID=A0A9D0YRA9_AQUAO|nr:LysM domain-containing protein [Aquificales bacterium]HIP98765.1 LysM domain-containing protein [Aquifex aeolicus]HIQ25930.1 LysM domain-containing protein [Aquifex aeolicus]